MFIWSQATPTHSRWLGTRRTPPTLATPRRTPADPVQSVPPVYTAVCSRLGPITIDSIEASQLSPDSTSPSMPTDTRASYRNHIYCDLLTDLATGRIYPIYTKDRSASELVKKVSIFFALHPSWQNQYDNVDRFIRLDPERNDRSEAFLQITASFGYRLERTTERDKHANGVAERTVGIITVKTNIAMPYANPPPSILRKPPDTFPLSYTASTKSILHNMSATLHFGEAFIVRPFHPMQTISPSTGWSHSLRTTMSSSAQSKPRTSLSPSHSQTPLSLRLSGML
jgi:hypothetical protein